MTAYTLACPLSERLHAFRENVYNNAQFYKKRITSLLMVYIVVFAILTMFAAFCSYTEGDGLTGLAQGYIVDIFGEGSVEDIRNLTHIDFNSSTFAFTVGSNTFGALGGILKNIYNIFKNLGYMLLIGNLLLGLMEDFSLNQVYIEKMIKKGIFFCIGIALIAKSVDIVFAITNIGSAVASKIGDVTAANMPSCDALCQEVYDKCNTAKDAGGILKWVKAMAEDTINGLSYVLQLFIPWVLSKIARLIISVTCWSRVIEILLMALVAPLAFSDISKANGEHSNAMRAVKNIFALSLSGAMILLICIVCTQIQGTLVTTADFKDSLYNCVIVGLVQMGLIKRANDIVKQGLGMA